MHLTSVDHVTDKIIGGAITLHRRFGPGLLESAYLLPLAHELMEQGLEVEVGRYLALHYKGLTVQNAYKIDLVVEQRVLVELKSVSKIAEIHVAQLLTYLRLTDMRVGLLLNFNSLRMIDGVRRVVNNHVDEDGNRI